jgi:hypothetical protein
MCDAASGECDQRGDDLARLWLETLCFRAVLGNTADSLADGAHLVAKSDVYEVNTRMPI